MLVTGKQLVKKMEQSSLQLYLNSTELEQVDLQHVDDLCKKFAERITVLQEIRCFIVFLEGTVTNPAI